MKINKLTLCLSRSLAPFGAWMEQLIAESTGKEGLGILPIDGEPVMNLPAYGRDRVFVVMKSKKDSAKTTAAFVKELKKEGFPLIQFDWNDPHVIGAEFLRWEIATAISSAVLNINPFDEPNVTESKINTNKNLEHWGKTGKASILKLFQPASKSEKELLSFIEAAKKSDYIVLLGYCQRTKEHLKELNGLRKTLGESFGKPVTVGFGPRYLHSIGQFYKGGPRKGVFLELLTTKGSNPGVPGEVYGFLDLLQAQALGDFQAIESKKMKITTISIGAGAPSQIKSLHQRLHCLLGEVSDKKLK